MGSDSRCDSLLQKFTTHLLAATLEVFMSRVSFLVFQFFAKTRKLIYKNNVLFILFQISFFIKLRFLTQDSMSRLEWIVFNLDLKNKIKSKQKEKLLIP